MAQQVTAKTFESDVLKSTVPVLVDFYADWCGPCKMLAPVIEELSAEATDAKVVKVNIDAEPELAQRYRVMSIPTLMVFKGGEAVNTAVGMRSKGQLQSMLNT